MRAREGASARLDGALGELESVWLDGHLSRCAACSTFAGHMAATAAVLRAAPLDPAPAGIFVRGRRRVVVPVAAVAASLAIAVTAPVRLVRTSCTKSPNPGSFACAPLSEPIVASPRNRSRA